jgi:hypothetical protein
MSNNAKRTSIDFKFSGSWQQENNKKNIFL